MSVLRDGPHENLHDLDERRDHIRIVLDKALELCGDAASGEAGEESCDLFISCFGDIVKDEIQAGMQPGEWQYIFPVLSDSMERLCGGTINRHRLNFLVHSCMALSAEMAMIRQNGINYEANNVNIVLREVEFGLSSIMRLEDLVDTLRKQLPRLGVGSFFASRFEKEWSHHPHTQWEIPEDSLFIAGALDSRELEVPEGDASKFPSKRLYPPGLIEDAKRRTLAVYPLFFRETHYGTIVYELTHRNGFVYESLTTQISGILKAITLFHAKEKAEDKLLQAMMELESFNRQLSNLSLTDELTGLYNRRGFLKLAPQQLRITKQMGKNALLIYGDVDGLKRINDGYGHDEGDFAIKSAAEVLKKVFRTMDIIARLGGDEFTIFASNTGEKRISYFQSKMSEQLENFNAASGKPYKLSISLGCSECLPSSELCFDEYMRDADARLYAQKVERKKSPPKA
jgi:diguanylate cyclase (GGDEF)-like protein